MAIKDYIRERFFPHIWCAGCGHGVVLNNLLRAVEKLGMSKNEIVMASGIGCSSRLSGYVDLESALHGLPVSAVEHRTVKRLANPEQRG
jgi:2-oxoglutarate ferredoxin oxidoreductase subunit beta